MRYILLVVCVFAQAAEWKFAVSGDSRNCGDVVMPAIAAGVRSSGSEFYWHLGDFRAMYTIDEDMVPPPKLGIAGRKLSLEEYGKIAWPDFIAHQIVPFGNLPVFLSIGNHETTAPGTREKYLIQFADWLTTPTLRAQRLKDDPSDHELRTYFHWVRRNVDFIALDNASADQFDAAQLRWFKSVVEHDEASGAIRSIVVGMHAALPGSFGSSHSMSDWPRGESSGREVYQALLHARDAAHKRVYLLASHSHFFMEDVFRNDYWKEQVLPGWIVGTAGAVRYKLPNGAASGHAAKQGVYGYMVGSVADDGSISFQFIETSLDDLLHANQGKQPEPLVRWCFSDNKQF